jgi:hypothetical protein
MFALKQLTVYIACNLKIAILQDNLFESFKYLWHDLVAWSNLLLSL